MKELPTSLNLILITLHKARLRADANRHHLLLQMRKSLLEKIGYALLNICLKPGNMIELKIVEIARLSQRVET